MKEPVVISVANTATLTVSPTLSAVLGPALLVVDRNDIEPSPEYFYIVSRASALVAASGAHLKPAYHASPLRALSLC